MHTLMDTPTGLHLVTTVSSFYFIDLDHMCVTRVPGMHDHEVSVMRQDGVTLPLLALAECTIRRGLVMFVDLGIPDVPWTARASTDVQSIEQVPRNEQAT